MRLYNKQRHKSQPRGFRIPASPWRAQDGKRLTDVPALRKEHAQEEDEEGDAGADPAVEDVRRRLVEERLVVLRALLVTVLRHRDSFVCRKCNAT
jgi:hypothetical protein